jgi:CHAT domain-containing protein
MVRYGSLLVIFLLLIAFPQGQNFKKLPEYERLYRLAEKLYASPNATDASDLEAISTYQQAIILLNKEKLYNEILADCYLKTGILKMSVNEQEQALQAFHQSIETIGKGNHLSDSLLFKPYLFAGSIHYNLNGLDSAAWFFNKAEVISNQFTRLNESERLFNKLGVLYYETGDYRKSINYFEKALSIIQDKKPVDVFFIVNYKNNIATALLKLGEYKKSLEIFTSLLQYHIAEDALCYNIGNNYIEEGKYKEALFYLQRIKQMDVEKFNSIAKVFIDLKQYDTAQLYLSKSTDALFDKKRSFKKVDYGVTLKYWGDVKAATGKHLNALADYQQAIIHLCPSFKDTSVSSNPLSFSGLQNFNLLFDALVAKAATLNSLNNQYQGQQYLQQSLNAFTSALLLAKYIEHTYFSDDARLFLKQKVNPATQQAVEVAIQLSNSPTQAKRYLDIAFDMVENNKASVLQAGIQNLQIPAISGIPVELIAQEKKYKVAIAKLRIQAGQEKDSAILSLLQKKNQDNEIALATVQKKLDENAVYHQLKANVGAINIDSFQHQVVAESDAVLSYYYTNRQLHCFYITREGVGLSSIPLSQQLFTTILSLRKELKDPQASGRKALQDTGSSLFNELVLPVFEKIKGKKHLIIIPYNEISYVPFEMLVNPKGGAPMLNQFAISYNYSANFFGDQKLKADKAYQVLAMAPFAETKNQHIVLPLLPSSADEIKYLPGKILFGAAANKNDFVASCGQFSIVHLATHAVANDTDPLGSYIEFYGLKSDADTLHRLYEQEIYNLDMKQARLLILSACETGNGSLVNGEGIISLSRAFSYAGCKSVVTSLWKADDVATSFIVKRLHLYLQKGLATDEALQKAKIDYLNSNDIDERFKTPAYWAHLILIGQHQPLIEIGISWYIILTAILLAGLLAFFLIKKRTGHN